jgi:hypothetical protein
LPKSQPGAGHWRLTPVTLATQEAEVRRIVVQCQPKQIVPKTLSQKNTSQKRAGGMAQGVDSEFKPQNHTHTKKVILKGIQI